MTEFTKLTPSYQGGEFAKPEHVIEVQEAVNQSEATISDHTSELASQGGRLTTAEAEFANITSGRVYVKDYESLVTGNDWTAAGLAAIADLPEEGGELIFPPGDIDISDTLLVPSSAKRVTIRGGGGGLAAYGETRGTTTLRGVGNITVLKLGDGLAKMRGCAVYDMTIVGSGIGNASMIGMRYQWHDLLTLVNVHASNCHTGMVLSESDAGTFIGCSWQWCTVGVSDSSDTYSRFLSCAISDNAGKSTFPYMGGMSITDSFGVRVAQSEFIRNGKNGVVLVNSDGCLFSDDIFAYSKDSNVLLLNGSDRNLFANCISAGGGVTGPSGDRNGYKIDGSTNTQIRGGYVVDILNFVPPDERGGVLSQDYGVREAGAADQTVVEGVSFAGNKTAPVLLVGANSKARRNTGYVTEASGTGTIASGATSAVVTHGLSVTPVAANISVTPTESPTNDPGNIWVSTITSTQFTVNCRNDPGASAMDFSWQAQVI